MWCISRYRIVIHAGIDGYSRLPVYCGCSNNNRAATVFQYFREAIANYGMPSRVRSDKGGENVNISRFMLQQRGTGRGSMLTGKSVHNQRIERFWRDVFEGCTVQFYSLFGDLEESQVLNPTNDIDLFCLHYVYTPRINRALDLFCKGYRRHTLSTAGHRSPLQLWIEGMLRGARLEDIEEMTAVSV